MFLIRTYRTKKYDIVFRTLRNKNSQLLIMLQSRSNRYKNKATRFIIKYVATKNLEITSIMLRKWLKSASKIEFITKETRKNRVNNVCQESEMKTFLLTQINETRNFDRKIIKRWFTRHVKKIYEELYSHREIKKSEKFTEYKEFRFFHDWFMNFK